MTRPIERNRIRSGLVDAGLPPPVAQCLARALVDRLTTAQLRKLQVLQGQRRSVADYLAAVARIDDEQVLRLAIEAAASCVPGQPRSSAFRPARE